MSISEHLTASGHRDEKTLNALIGRALKPHLPHSEVEAERSGKFMRSQKQPDMVVDTPGRERVLIENKYDSTPIRELENQCSKHLKNKETWKDIDIPVRVVVGMISPKSLDDYSDDSLIGGQLAKVTYKYAMWSRSGDTINRFPQSGFLKGKMTDLAIFIDRAGSEGADTDPMVQHVQEGLTAAAKTATQGVEVAEAFGKVLTQEPGEQTNHMAMAVMFNAMLFQFHIQKHHSAIPSLAVLKEDGFNQSQVLEVWQQILGINYWPIFGVARRLLLAVKGVEDARRMLTTLSRTAEQITSDPNASSLVGQLFGELIGDRKFLATFYTRPASAALLSELAISRLDIDWSSLDSIAELRIGDMACGTGALLTASYRRIAERFRATGGNVRDLHCALIEDMLIGCDIMSAAVHLTAARLSGEGPDIDYTKTKTWVMPFGKVGDVRDVQGYRIGALDLLHADEQPALWGDGTLGMTAQGEDPTTAEIPAKSLDIVIMNPPFTRPTNHEATHAKVPNPAFAGLGTDQETQKIMSKILSDAKKKIQWTSAGDGNAGIASNFIDLAHSKLRPGGVLAVIVPASVVSGRAWRNTRSLLAKHYRDVVVLSISEHGEGTSQGRAFSADTGMAESIIVATKRNKPGRKDTIRATFVALNDRPDSPLTGLEVARCVGTGRAEPGKLLVGGQIVGWLTNSDFGPDTRWHPSGVSNMEVAVVSSDISGSRILLLPRHTQLDIPISRLDDLGYRGPVDRDISGKHPNHSPRGPFDVVKLKHRALYDQASWPILWSHEYTAETSMVVLPCSEGVIRPGMRDQALKIWQGYENNSKNQIAGATRLHINRDFQVNSQSTAACLTPVPTIGGHWISFSPDTSGESSSENWEKAICVWLNSTLGLLGRWGISNRQQKGRARLTVTTIGNIPMLDLRAIPSEQVDGLASVFDTYANQPMLPANEAVIDETRQKLDKEILCGVLGFPDSVLDPLATLRNQWCAEPSVHGDKKRQSEPL